MYDRINLKNTHLLLRYKVLGSIQQFITCVSEGINIQISDMQRCKVSNSDYLRVRRSKYPSIRRQHETKSSCAVVRVVTLLLLAAAAAAVAAAAVAVLWFWFWFWLWLWW